VLLVDDHEGFRDAARADLEDGGFEVVAEVGTAACAVPTAARLRPDLVLLDIRLPDGDGIDVASDLATALPETLVVLISTVPAEDALERMESARSTARFLSKTKLSSHTLRSLIES
jgi:DNA-binding NarL/FixJ family response regulator